MSDSGKWDNLWPMRCGIKVLIDIFLGILVKGESKVANTKVASWLTRYSALSEIACCTFRRVTNKCRIIKQSMQVTSLCHSLIESIFLHPRATFRSPPHRDRKRGGGAGLLHSACRPPGGPSLALAYPRPWLLPTSELRRQIASSSPWRQQWELMGRSWTPILAHVGSAVVQPSSRHRGGREEVGVMHIRPY